MNQSLSIWVVSDVHLGHANTATVDIIERLNKLIPNDPVMEGCDLLCITGDLFDRLLSLPDPNVVYIKNWMARLLFICEKYRVKLRILEGTPSHDWKQSRLFVQLQQLLKVEVDVAYFDVLDIEVIPEWDLSILYVPDEWNINNDDTWTEVQKLLHFNNRSAVDVVLMHGAFSYQLNEHVKANTHRPDWYAGIVNHLLFIGHIHVPSVRDRLVAPGSFDRLAHGEEHPKGMISAKIRPSGTYDLTFIENTEAQPYETIDLTGLSLKSAIKTLARRCQLIQRPRSLSFLRVIANRTDTVLETVQKLKVDYPQIKFSTKYTSVEGVYAELPLLPQKFQPTNINEDTIARIVRDRLIQKGIVDEELTRMLEVLNAHCSR